jgi:prefoldin subunit 5
MSGQGDGSFYAVQEQDVTTTDTITRSRTFLETKLIPDLEEATSFVSHLKESRDGYLKLQQELKTTQEQRKATSVLAHLGQGVHLPVDIAADSPVIVSSGLKESPQDWQLDSGLYLQLDREEAITFAAKKVEILNRWGK